MPIGFTYFISKDLRDIKLESLVDRAARYMSEPVINKMNPTWVNIIHGFLVVYINCKRPRAGRGINAGSKEIVNNLKGLDLYLNYMYDTNQGKMQKPTSTRAG